MTLRALFGISIIVAMTVIAIVAAACGTVKASNVYAGQISGPGGYTCFAIYADGLVKGGNCIRD